jgi:transglutaminase-like putative cysteine protease
MTQTLSIQHTTTYHYDKPVPYALLQLRLRPKDHHGQTVRDWVVDVQGGKIEVEYDDQNCNHVTLISFDADVTEVTVTSRGQVDIKETNGISGQHQGFTPLWLFEQPTPLTKAGPACRKILGKVSGEVGTLAWLHDLSNMIRSTVAYEIGASNVGYSAEDAAQAGHGVCQDHTHVFIACCRAVDLPSRYISGYLMMDDRTHQDATHAWAETYVKDLGWVGFDISNGISPDRRYVRVASGLDYADAAPVSGTRFGTASESMAVQLQVQQ